MKLVANIKLQPTPGQAQALLDTMEQANAACNYISQVAWDSQTFGQFNLHKLTYHNVRERFPLTAQVVVRCNAKVADAYKLDRKTKREFRPHGSIAYDDRILRYYPDQVSIWTTAGRMKVPFLTGERQRELLKTRKGETDLVYHNGSFFLNAVCEVDEPPTGDPKDFLGVDLGIVNIAVDSDGESFSGGHLNGLRKRHRKLRATLQKKGTKSAKRLLKKRKRKEGRFARNINHTIAKRLVAKAKRTGRGIALEDLKDIRSRIRARRPQRSKLSSWAFNQLGQFVSYKARMAGVKVVFVDPRNTSRTCPVCGNIDKLNRPNQAIFSCTRCGFAGLADAIAAENIRRVVVNQPHVATACS